jgi:hypothetical protein
VWQLGTCSSAPSRVSVKQRMVHEFQAVHGNSVELLPIPEKSLNTSPVSGCVSRRLCTNPAAQYEFRETILTHVRPSNFITHRQAGESIEAKVRESCPRWMESDVCVPCFALKLRHPKTLAPFYPCGTLGLLSQAL